MLSSAIGVTATRQRLEEFRASDSGKVGAPRTGVVVEHKERRLFFRRPRRHDNALTTARARTGAADKLKRGAQPGVASRAGKGNAVAHAGAPSLKGIRDSGSRRPVVGSSVCGAAMASGGRAKHASYP